ncbi:MAG TPA: peptidoglycan-binding protein LysM [Gammaproteobacteria bacterium]|nr:peptidoglycan-binding protein LysM [Gammaproteobacteria bacterium]
MGLFDFAKNIGNKIFGKDDDPAEKIKEHIEEDNPGIDDLKVVYEDGKAVISGTAKSPEAVEKVILMAGNARGVEMVDASAVVGAQPSMEIEYYVIQKGDTLSGIAKKFLGNAMDYPKIFEANREVIKDPDLIFPGQKIRIPK